MPERAFTSRLPPLTVGIPESFDREEDNDHPPENSPRPRDDGRDYHGYGHDGGHGGATHGGAPAPPPSCIDGVGAGHVSAPHPETMSQARARIGSVHEEADRGRHHFTGEKLANIEVDDPFAPVFRAVDKVQELALPLLLGVAVAMFMANVYPETYAFYLKSDRCLSGGAPIDDEIHTTLDDASAAGHGGEEACHEERFLLSDCTMFGHQVTLHFVANDLVMCFFFALAMKEITEALLPGGSLNPPSKATNPLLCTLGGVGGPVLCYFLLLPLLVHLGLFEDEIARGVTIADLHAGWGVVAATDIVLAWLVGRLVFGDGHPAIDFLLLLAVADDAIGMAIIAVFYSDPDRPVRPYYLLVVGAGAGCAYGLRRWHFRKGRVTHQAWQPYVLYAGVCCWVGLINARLHPALALCFVVPFMPGPDMEKLAYLDAEVEDEIEEEMAQGKAHIVEMLEEHRRHTAEQSLSHLHDRGLHVVDHLPVSVPGRADIFADHHNHPAHFVSIQAGLFSGLAGHQVDEAFKVREYDEEGNETLRVSTLDEFEHFWKFYVDFGLGLFALVNAGVEITGVGAMTGLVVTSLVAGKYLGIVAMFLLAKQAGFYPPLGVRLKHVHMIGLLASMGLTVALFVSDIAFADAGLQGDAKVGALLSALSGLVAYAVSKVVDFRHEDVGAEAAAQLEEELDEAIQRAERLNRSYTISGHGGGSLSRGGSGARGESFAHPASPREQAPGNTSAVFGSSSRGASASGSGWHQAQAPQSSSGGEGGAQAAPSHQPGHLPGHLPGPRDVAAAGFTPLSRGGFSSFRALPEAEEGSGHRHHAPRDAIGSFRGEQHALGLAGALGGSSPASGPTGLDVPALTRGASDGISSFRGGGAAPATRAAATRAVAGKAGGGASEERPPSPRLPSPGRGLGSGGGAGAGRVSPSSPLEAGHPWGSSGGGVGGGGGGGADAAPRLFAPANVTAPALALASPLRVPGLSPLQASAPAGDPPSQLEATPTTSLRKRISFASDLGQGGGGSLGAGAAGPRPGEARSVTMGSECEL